MSIIKDIKNAVRNLPRKGQHNFVKIVCLALGLAVSSVIIAEIYYEQTYDTFFDGHERTFRVNETIAQNGDFKEYGNTSGAVAHGIKAYSPQVEAATRYINFTDDAQCEVGRKKGLSATMVLADSCFFDIFPSDILEGDEKESLRRPFYCLVSRSFAEKVGRNVIGKRISMAAIPSPGLTIGGVFEDYPHNSSLHNINVIASNAILQYAAFDGRENWIGNDGYTSYVRFAKGSTPEDVKTNVEKMVKDNLPVKELKKSGIEMGFTFTNISEVYTNDPYVKTIFWILSLLATLLLMSSVMNYLLIVVGNIVNRTREMAIRKCFGAGRGNLHSLIFSEALVHVVIAVVLAAALVFVCKGSIEEFVSAPLSVLIFNRGSWILVVVCIVVLLIGGVIPGILYSRIPVTSAFRGYNKNRNRWKLALLSVQFMAASLMFSLLFIVSSQYNLLVSDNPGFRYDNLAVLNIDGINAAQRGNIVQDLKRMPEVEQVSTCSCLPLNDVSGNNIYLPGDYRDLFNVVDMYNVSDGYMNLMDIKIVEGSNFTERIDSSTQIMVDRRFVEKLRKTAPFNGSIIGKRISITEHCDSVHPYFTVCGVFDNIRIGTASKPDDRPVVMFYNKKASNNILIRFHNLTTDNMQKVRTMVEDECPDRVIWLTDYATINADKYTKQRNLRNGVLVAGVITLLIALIGLVGYTVDEVNRRSKEIAIRKVNGATVADILGIFIRSIMVIALPSVVVGCIASYIIAAEWIQSFAKRISISPLYFIVTAIVMIGIIVAMVVINSRKVANSNPMKYLKDE